MAGHSHSRKVHDQKQANDQRKGRLFAKLARALAVAAREGGLEAVIERARKAGMPHDRIRSAVEGSPSIKDERRVYEAKSSDGTLLVIDCLTDNSNRTVAEIRNILEKHGGALLAPRSVLSQAPYLAEAAVNAALREDLEACEDVDAVRGFR